MQVPLMDDVAAQLTELRDAARNTGVWSTADVLTPTVPVPNHVFWYSLGASYTGAVRLVASAAGTVTVAVGFDNPLHPLDYVTADSMLCGYWTRLDSSPNASVAALDVTDAGFTVSLEAAAAGTFDVCWQVGEYYVRAEDQSEE